MSKQHMLAALLVSVIIAMGIAITPAFAADKTINCEDGCKINFKGKNDVDIKFGGAGTGQQGEKGDKGDKGDQGEQGVPGEKGEKGDTGEAGPPGVSGVSGTNGTVLDDATVNNLQFINEHFDAIKDIVNAWNDGTLGVPTEVGTSNDTNTNPVDNNTNPIPEPVDNQTSNDNETNNNNGTQ